jgi:hypothetical protein
VQDGNEPDGVESTPEQRQLWSLSTQNIMRAVEQEKGYQHHAFVTNAGSDQLHAAPQVNGISVHTTQIIEAGDKPYFNNEFNPNPPWTAEQWQQVRCRSEAYGAWVWAWRHGQDQQTWEQTLGKMKAGCAGVPVEGCPYNVPATDTIFCKNHTAWEDGRRWDCTPKANGQPIRPEGDPLRAECELKSMGGVYPTFSLDGPMLLTPLGNPLQFKLTGSGTGTLHCVIPSGDKCNYAISQ